MKKNSLVNRKLVKKIGTICLCIAVLIITGTNAFAMEKGIASHDLIFLSASELAQKIRLRQVTSLEVVDAYLAQIAKHNGKLNAIVTLDKDGARQRAKEADKALIRGEIWGPLHGVPMTIKDNIATAGMKTTSSLPALAKYVPSADAPVVERLRKAGAIIIGKTNLPSMGMDVQANSPVFGTANNPWDISRTPGGSTGGGAAAIAAGLSPLEIGNDLAGSIRIPSHFCGIYGLKPTQHMVSLSGSLPGLPTPDMPKFDFKTTPHLPVQGPLARSIDDLKLALTIIAGTDPDDVDVPLANLNDTGKKDLKKLRIAWTDDFGGVPVTAETRTALKALAEKLSQQGCKVEKVNPPGFDFMLAWNTYGDLLDMEGFGPYLPWYARFLQYVTGTSKRKEVPTSRMVYPMSYEKYLKVLTKRGKLIAIMDRFLTPYDAYLCPVTSTPAFNHMPPERYLGGVLPVHNGKIMVDEKALNYWVANVSYPTIFNLTGNPVVVIPMGHTQQGLPLGVQIVGKRWHDMELLSVAKTIDGASGAFRHPPGY
jgi:amidase